MFSRLSNSWKIVLQLVFVAAICTLAAYILFSLGLMNRSSNSHRVQFQVEASGAVAIITLQAGDFSISEPTTVSAPWSKTMNVSTGTQVYLTALNPTQTGQLTCSITLDNAPWKLERTSAPKDGVACAGIVP